MFCNLDVQCLTLKLFKNPISFVSTSFSLVPWNRLSLFMCCRCRNGWGKRSDPHCFRMGLFGTFSPHLQNPSPIIYCFKEVLWRSISWVCWFFRKYSSWHSSSYRSHGIQTWVLFPSIPLPSILPISLPFWPRSPSWPQSLCATCWRMRFRGRVRSS